MKFARWFSLVVLAVSLAVQLGSVAKAEDENELWARLREERWSLTESPASRDCYAAIAYSPKMGKSAYSCGWYSLAPAKREAIKECNTPDAGWVVWVENGYCALAL